MTADKALDIFREDMACPSIEEAEKYNEIVIDALDKQIPKSPTKVIE